MYCMRCGASTDCCNRFLGNNQLTEVSAGLFQGLTNLQTLYVRGSWVRQGTADGGYLWQGHFSEFADGG
jgi:hypothetical protein